MVTLGDLHGNAVKLLHFLMRYGVVIWKASVADKAAAYQSFVDIYDRAAELLKFRNLMINLQGDIQNSSTKNEVYRSEFDRLKVLSAPKEWMLLIRRFDVLMSQLAVQDAMTQVRLLGDELADRGSNDYFTLRLLGFLQEAHVQVSILSSNHGAQFLDDYHGISS